VADDPRIRVIGVKDLQKALRDVDKDLPKELAAGLAEASEIVLNAARPLVPRKSGEAQDSMKVRKQQRGAAIAVGGSKAPHFGFIEFGGTVGRGHVPRSGGGAIKRPFITEGRSIYPSLREKRPEVEAKIDEVLKDMATKAGFETKGKA
jgi:hypothetical protein